MLPEKAEAQTNSPNRPNRMRQMIVAGSAGGLATLAGVFFALEKDTLRLLSMKPRQINDVFISALYDLYPHFDGLYSIITEARIQRDCALYYRKHIAHALEALEFIQNNKGNFQHDYATRHYWAIEEPRVRNNLPIYQQCLERCLSKQDEILGKFRQLQDSIANNFGLDLVMKILLVAMLICVIAKMLSVLKYSAGEAHSRFFQSNNLRSNDQTSVVASTSSSRATSTIQNRSSRSLEAGETSRESSKFLGRF